MAMGRQKDGQGDLMVSWSEMPRSPGHVGTSKNSPFSGVVDLESG